MGWESLPTTAVLVGGMYAADAGDAGALAVAGAGGGGGAAGLASGALCRRKRLGLCVGRPAAVVAATLGGTVVAPHTLVA